MARAIEELLKVARLGERNRRVIQVLDETTSCRSDRFDQPGSVAGKPLCVRPGLEVRKPLPAQHFDQSKRIACATQGLGRVAIQAMGSRDSLGPIGMILEWTGVEPRSRGQASRQSFQAGSSYLGLHSIDGADRHEVAINEIIQTPRLQPGPASRECGGTRTRPDDQHGFHGVHKKSPAPHSGRTRLTFEYRQALVGSRCSTPFGITEVGISSIAGVPANNWVSPTRSLTHSIFLIFSVGVSTSLSPFFSQVPVTSTFNGSSFEALQNPRLL
jgi:hypothetical protein